MMLTHIFNSHYLYLGVCLMMAAIDKYSCNFSAAKAPYLAKFRVQHVGLSGLEELGKSDQIPSFTDESRQSWQSCIFKVGDDVRQVGTSASILHR